MMFRVRGESRGWIARRAALAWAAAATALAACQQTTAGDTVVICDSAGCREQPRSLQTYDPASAVPPDDPRGILPALEREAARDPRAAFDLGMRYMRGDGLRRRPHKALEWMRDAAGRGDLRAQAALGRLYLTGLEEMGPDYREAESWLSRAAAGGHAESARLLEEARARRAAEPEWEDQVERWRRSYTAPYWYRSRYYGYWRGGSYAYY
jgi:TPR repeat protein